MTKFIDSLVKSIFPSPKFNFVLSEGFANSLNLNSEEKKIKKMKEIRRMLRDSIILKSNKTDFVCKTEEKLYSFESTFKDFKSYNLAKSPSGILIMDGNVILAKTNPGYLYLKHYFELDKKDHYFSYDGEVFHNSFTLDIDNKKRVLLLIEMKRFNLYGSLGDTVNYDFFDIDKQNSKVIAEAHFRNFSQDVITQSAKIGIGYSKLQDETTFKLSNFDSTISSLGGSWPNFLTTSSKTIIYDTKTCKWRTLSKEVDVDYTHALI